MDRKWTKNGQKWTENGQKWTENRPEWTKNKKSALVKNGTIQTIVK